MDAATNHSVDFAKCTPTQDLKTGIINAIIPLRIIVGENPPVNLPATEPKRRIKFFAV